MKDNFGEFEWKNYKDVQPEANMYVYVYFVDEDEVDIGLAKEYDWAGDMYWCYVYMPDVPKIEKKEDICLSVRVENMENFINIFHKELMKINEKVKKLEVGNELVKREIYEKEVCNPFSDGG